MKRHIPNIFTLSNLVSGCLGIWLIQRGSPQEAAYFIWIGAFFDYLDGYTARLLKVESPIGKELDSLADVVTFGVLPSFIMFSLMTAQDGGLLPFVAFFIVIAAALRLARFNTEDPTPHFSGLPTPAAAFLISSFPFIQVNGVPGSGYKYLLALLALFIGFLMVSRLRLLSMKFKGSGWNENWKRYLLILLFIPAVFVFRQYAIPLIFAVYILLSLFERP